MSTYIRRRPDPSDRLSGNRWALLAIAFHLFVVVTRLSDALPGWQVAKVTLLLATALALHSPSRSRITMASTEVRLVIALFALSVLSLITSAWPSQTFNYITSTSILLTWCFILLVSCIKTPADAALITWALMISLSSLAWVYLAAPPGVNVTNTYDRNDLAFVFSMGLFAGLGNMLFAKGWQRWAALGVIVTTLLGVVKTASRAGFVTLAVVGLYALWRYRSRALVPGLLSIAAIALVVGVYAPADYWDRMSTIYSDAPSENVSDYDAGGLYAARWTVWVGGLKLLLFNPILGVGAGAYEVAEGLSHQGVGRWGASHNSFIQVAVELGLPGLVAFVWFVARGFTNYRHAARAMRRRQLWPRYQWLPEALTLSLLAYVVAGLSLSQGYSIMLYTLLAVATALRAVAERASSDGAHGLTDPQRFGRERRWVPSSSARPVAPGRLVNSLTRLLPILCVTALLSLPAGLDAQTAASPGQDRKIPALSQWKSNMVRYGRRHCDYLKQAGNTADAKLANTYYDQVRVFHQIAKYTGEDVWLDCARRARAVYRDWYVFRNAGGVPGYWNFTTGLRMDYELTKDPASRQAVILLSTSAAFSADSTPIEWIIPVPLSREVAYALLAHQDAEALGAPPRPLRRQLRDIAYGHFAQWFGGATYRGSGRQFSPFIVALSAHSLIRDWEETRDPRCLPTLRQAADWLWSNAWDSKAGGMAYDINGIDGGTTGAVDLNLLIAPMYAFLYAETGDSKYRDQGDALFSAGVHHAFLETASSSTRTTCGASTSSDGGRRANAEPATLQVHLDETCPSGTAPASS